MHVILLCPGPSLARLRELPAHDVSIAVNRAALAFPCDWWAALDFQTVQRHVPAGDPKLLIRAEYRPKYTTRPGLDAESLACPVPKFDLFTATAALALAAHLGATQVDVYGADWSQAPDFDGHAAGLDRRDAARWENEIPIWNEVCRWLESLGIQTKRRHGDKVSG